MRSCSRGSGEGCSSAPISYPPRFPKVIADPRAMEEMLTILKELQRAGTEMLGQNEELEFANRAKETERKSYLQLFNFAPYGYLVTSPKGVIMEANLAAARSLNMDQEPLVGKPLSLFIGKEDQRSFCTHLIREARGRRPAWPSSRG